MGKDEIEKDKAFWVGFNYFAGVGPRKFKVLLDYFGSAKEAWEANASELSYILGIGLWEKFRELRAKFKPREYIRQIERIKGIRVLILPEDRYPQLLKEIDNPPPVLYVLGNPKVLLKPQIAVVGTRKMTDYGAKVARELVRGLVEAGLVITSGLAFGIDTVAHKTALGEKGATIAVLGCGVDLCYPADHYQIYNKIIKEGGAVISEIPPGIQTVRGIFVARNRIISGLTLGTLVIEGAKNSGTLITAGYAAAQGREVFAVPGPITSIFSDGPNKLIRDGAKLVTKVEDILEELQSENLKANILIRGIGKIREIGEILKQAESEEERKVLEALVDSGEGAQIDTIIRKSGLDSGKVASIISILEVKGVVGNFGGGRYGIV